MNVKGLCPLLEGSRRVFVDLLETQTHSPTAHVSVHICTLPESDTRTNTPRQMQIVTISTLNKYVKENLLSGPAFRSWGTYIISYKNAYTTSHSRAMNPSVAYIVHEFRNTLDICGVL